MGRNIAETIIGKDDSMNKQEELLRSLNGKQLSFHLYLTQIILFIIAIILNLIFFPDLSTYLLLFQWDSFWVSIGILSGLCVVLLDIALMKVVPKSYYDDGGINEKIFTSLPIWNIILVSLVIAIAEELLFRGAIQTKLGLIGASIIFALIHFRYWKHWYLLLNVLVLSFWLGLIYKWSGLLLPVILMHFTIDFLLGLYIKRKANKLEKKGFK